MKEEREAGNWKWEPPKRKKKPKVKRKFRWKEKEEEEAKLAAEKEEKEKRIRQEKKEMNSVEPDFGCKWKMKDPKTGQEYYCSNLRLAAEDDELESTSIAVKEDHRYCGFHTPLCVNGRKHQNYIHHCHPVGAPGAGAARAGAAGDDPEAEENKLYGDDDLDDAAKEKKKAAEAAAAAAAAASQKRKKVDVPNAMALCNECYRERTKGKPPKLPELRVPGVLKVRTDTLVQMAKLKDDDNVVIEEETEDTLTKDSICEFRALNPANGHWYECTSKVIRHATTKQLLRVCGYHQKICVAQHDGMRVPIPTPNECGMCTAHYVSAMKRRPEEYDSVWCLPVVKEIIPPKKKPPPRHPLEPRGKPHKPKPPEPPPSVRPYETNRYLTDVKQRH